MTELYTWLAGAGVVVIAIIGAWWSGHSKGKAVAETKAEQDKAAASVAAAQAVTQKQSTVVKEASNAEQKVANSSDADVDSELLNKWQRKE
jgi:hypothetical protein